MLGREWRVNLNLGKLGAQSDFLESDRAESVSSAYPMSRLITNMPLEPGLGVVGEDISLLTNVSSNVSLLLSVYILVCKGQYVINILRTILRFHPCCHAHV